MKEYSTLPLHTDEEVIEEFGVSRKYTFLLIGVGIASLGLAVTVFLSAAQLERLFTGPAGVLAPLLAGAIWIGLGILGLYLVAVGVYLQLAYKYFLTNQRVIETVGLFAQRTASSEYGQINDIVVRQDFINRLLLGTGTIGISTPGTAVEEYQLINVDRPVARRELIRDLIRGTMDGRHIDKYLIAHLMERHGLAPDEQAALDLLDVSVGKDPLTEAALGEVSPAYQQHLADFHEQAASSVTSDLSVPSDQSSDEPAVEDLLGDGIDESDRLRAAQRKIDSE